MLRKKITTILMMAVVLLLFAGCQNASKESEYICTTSEISNDPLVICVDFPSRMSENGDIVIEDTPIRRFLEKVEHTGGVTDAAVFFIPPNGAEREACMDRLRVEIMAGGGPDVFLMAYHTELELDDSQNLFGYPEQAMANGLFLPLDEYMEKHTRFTEWDKQTPGVMAAGRNEEGQQIIPLSYTLPMIVYEQAEFEYTPTRELSWHDMLNDPELSPYALDLANCRDYDRLAGVSGDVDFVQNYLPYILGPIYNFEEEELDFTEEELLQRVNEILALDRDDIHDDLEQDYYSAIEEWMGLRLSNETYNQPMTMIPMYSDDGGVTAQIQSYAAVNRNTRHPEEAFAVLDILMWKKVQQEDLMYLHYIQDVFCFSMHEDLLQQDTPVHVKYYLRDENYQELCEVRDQITGANFVGRHNRVLNDLLYNCSHVETRDKTVEEFVHGAYRDLQRRVKE